MKRLTETEQQLVLSNIDIAQKAVARELRAQPKATYEELLSSAYYALCEVAIGSHQGERFRSIAFTACRRRIWLDQIRLHRNHIGKYPLIRKMINEVSDVPNILDRLVSTEDLVRVISALPGLDPRPKQVLGLILNGITQTEIAVKLHLDISTVSRHVTRGVTRLKKKLSLEYVKKA
jgi:RNA polymerase sigma factor (sigma-70 family)